MQETEKVQQIPVKVYRTSDRLMIAAPLPGMEPEDILVQISQDDRLVIQGMVRGMLKDIKELLLDEWSAGSYYRELALPNTVDAAHANVTYGNGVLVIVLPISSQTIPATLKLDKTGIAHGERVGNSGQLSL